MYPNAPYNRERYFWSRTRTKPTDEPQPERKTITAHTCGKGLVGMSRGGGANKPPGNSEREEKQEHLLSMRT